MSQVRALVRLTLVGLDEVVSRGGGESASARAHQELVLADVERFLGRPDRLVSSPLALEPPPGSPIGDAGLDWLRATLNCDWER